MQYGKRQSCGIIKCGLMSILVKRIRDIVEMPWIKPGLWSKLAARGSWRNTTRNVALSTLSSNLVCSVSGLKGFTWVEIYKNHYNRLSESIKEVLSHYSSLFLWWTLLHHPKFSAFPALILSTPSKSGMFALSCWRWKCCARLCVRNKKYGKGDCDGMAK